MAAALQTYELQLLDLIGEALAGDLGIDTEALDDAATNTVRNIISALPLRLIDQMGAATALTAGTGVAITTSKIFGVTRVDANGIVRPAHKVSHVFEERLEDTDDLMYASPNDPAWFPKNGKVYIKPDPTTSEAGSISAVSYPTIDASADSSVTGFPDELEPLIVLGMLIWVKLREMGLARRDSQTELEAITSSGYLAAFEGDLPVFSPPTAPSMPTLTLVSMTTLPTLTLESAPTFTGLDLTGISVPVNTLSYTSAGAEPEDTISVTTPLPAYSGPTAFTYDTTHIADALTQMQDMMDNSGIGSSDVEAYIDTDKHLTRAGVGIQAILAEGQRAQASIQDERAQLQDVVEKIREALGKFTGDANVYQAELAKEIAEARVDVAAYTAKMQDNRNVLDKDIAQLNADIQNFSAQVRAKAQEWQLEEVNFKLAKWIGQVQSQTAGYSALAGSYISENSTKNQALIGEFGANAGAVVSEYNALVQGGGTEFQSNLSKAMSRLQQSQVRLQTMQSFDQKSTMALNEAKMLQDNFDKKLEEYKSIRG